MRARWKVHAIGAVLIALCFGVGLGARAFYDQHTRTDRATAFIKIFRSYCLPYAETGEVPFLGGLVKTNAAGTELFVDGTNFIGVAFKENRCTTTDVLMPLSDKDRDAVAVNLLALAPRLFPRLPEIEARRDLAGPGAFLIWESPHDWGDPQRWAVSLSRYYVDPARDPTSLMIGGPFGDGYPFGPET